MTVLSFVERLALGQDDSIMLYRGVTLSGRHFFAFIRCDHHGVEKLRHDSLHASPKDLNEYGEVIYMDFRSDPDQRAEDFLAHYLRVEEKLARLEALV